MWPHDFFLSGDIAIFFLILLRVRQSIDSSYAGSTELLIRKWLHVVHRDLESNESEKLSKIFKGKMW